MIFDFQYFFWYLIILYILYDNKNSQKYLLKSYRYVVGNVVLLSFIPIVNCPLAGLLERNYILPQLTPSDSRQIPGFEKSRSGEIDLDF